MVRDSNSMWAIAIDGHEQNRTPELNRVDAINRSAGTLLYNRRSSSIPTRRRSNLTLLAIPFL